MIIFVSKRSINDPSPSFLGRPHLSSYGSTLSTGKGKGDGRAPVGNQLGWVMGVFVPTMLGIFGVVTFLRMGWVVGQVRPLTEPSIALTEKCRVDSS